MADLLFILVLLAFFALMVLFVRVCERIVGTDDADGTVDVATEDLVAPEEVPA